MSKQLTYFLFLTILLPSLGFSQTITGPELLEKTIKFHDPKGEWSEANITLNLLGEYASGAKITSQIWLNVANNNYQSHATREDRKIITGVENDSCFASLDGSSAFSEEEMKQFRLDCSSIKRMHNYHLYLYGLPMKLRDKGTIIEPEVTKQTLNEQEYLILKVRYEPPTGEHTWLFFIHPETYAMEAYQFYKDEVTKAGEIIYLEELQKVGKMKLPSIRKWYQLPRDKFLGTDIIQGGKKVK